MSAQVWETVTQFAVRFAPPVSPAAPFGPTTPAEVIQAHEDACRDWTRQLAEQLAYTHGLAWGTKRANGSRPISKDTVCTQIPFLGYDILRASGTGLPSLAVYPPLQSDLVGQVFVPVVATDHLGTPTDPPDPPDDGENDDGCDLAADLSAIKSELQAGNEQRQLIIELLSRLVPLIQALPTDASLRASALPVRLKW